MQDQKRSGSEPVATAAAKSPYLKGLLVVGITSGYIFGPMIVFGAIGWWLTNMYDSMLYIFGALIIALVSSNLLIFRNTNRMVYKIGETSTAPKDKKSDGQNDEKSTK